MNKKDVIDTIDDIVEQYTFLPLMFFTLGNYGKGYNVKEVIHPYELSSFREQVERSLNIKLTENIDNMHIRAFCNLCIVKAKSVITR